MNKFISLALVLLASVAIASGYGQPAAQYGQQPTGPAIERVDYSTLGVNLDPYLGGSAPSGNYGNKQVITGYVPATNVAVAPARSGYGASQNAYAAPASYNSRAGQSYNAPAASQGYGYGSAPKYTSQPAYSTELYPGQANYQAYQSPPSYSRVALPVAASDPVAKLFVQQQQKSYGAQANNYGAQY